MPGMGRIDDAARDLDILLERLVAGVDHHRAVETRVDAIHARLLVAVIEVDGENGLRKDLSAARMIASSISLSVYFRAPLLIWIMNGAWLST